MKRFALALTICVLMILASCSKENPIYEIKFANAEDDPTFCQANVSASKGSTLVNLTATFDYEVSIECEGGSWLTYSTASRDRIWLEYEANEDYLERKATVNLCHGKTVVATIGVQQNGADVVLKYAAPENEIFRRVAFFPYYRDLSESSIPDEYLKTCNVAVFAFAHIQSDYSIVIQQPKKLVTLVKRCREAGVEKVLLAFSGGRSLYVEMTRSATRRQKFVNTLMQFVDLYELDGIDNDWEYPTSSNDSKHNNLILMRMLSNELHAPGVNKILTMDITDGRWSGGYREGIDPGVYDCCDWFNNMSYNSVVASDKPEKYDACKIMETSYNWWVVTKKMPKHKFVLGLPLYGTDPYTDTSWGYATILKSGGDPQKDIAQLTGSDGVKHTFYYNGIPTVTKKVQTMKDRDCGGYMFWEASFDSFDEFSLLKAAYKTATK